MHIILIKNNMDRIKFTIKKKIIKKNFKKRRKKYEKVE